MTCLELGCMLENDEESPLHTRYSKLILKCTGYVIE